MSGKKNHICLPYFGSADVVVNEAVKDPVVPHSAAREDASHTSAAMDHRHVRCCSQMHCVIRLHPSSFDEAPALRYLGVCTKGAPDQQATTNMAAALAIIPETPDASIETDTTRMFDAKRTGGGTVYALDMTGSACPRRLTAAILDNAGAGSASSFDLYAPSAIKSTVKHVDPSELLRPLFSELDAGRVDFYPATRMIKATVAYNCHMACDANPAPRTSHRLDQRCSSLRACRVHRSGHSVQRGGNLQPHAPAPLSRHALEAFKEFLECTTLGGELTWGRPQLRSGSLSPIRPAPLHWTSRGRRAVGSRTRLCVDYGYRPRSDTLLRYAVGKNLIGTRRRRHMIPALPFLGLFAAGGGPALERARVTPARPSKAPPGEAIRPVCPRPCHPGTLPCRRR